MVFVGDDAFPLSTRCMKPYSKRALSDGERIFNYRLSRFHRVSENAFGIWINRFRPFANRAALAPGKIEIVVLASLVLHNILRTMSKSSYMPTEFVDHETDEGTIIPGSWREEVSPSNIGDLQCESPTRATDSAEQARNKLKYYFMTRSGAMAMEHFT